MNGSLLVDCVKEMELSMLGRGRRGGKDQQAENVSTALILDQILEYDFVWFSLSQKANRLMVETLLVNHQDTRPSAH